ncbi:MAG: hypothetical protein M3N08_07400 [Pseudomonadota bacterium]|nr:hypothetical protein [Pseudomonadota bacterium]
MPAPQAPRPNGIDEDFASLLYERAGQLLTRHPSPLATRMLLEAAPHVAKEDAPQYALSLFERLLQPATTGPQAEEILAKFATVIRRAYAFMRDDIDPQDTHAVFTRAIRSSVENARASLRTGGVQKQKAVGEALQSLNEHSGMAPLEIILTPDAKTRAASAHGPR